MKETQLDETKRRAPDDSPDPDLKLVEQILGGDGQAFEVLVRRHERRVYRVTLAVTGNAEDAEDAMQETFLKVFRRLGDFRRESRFTTWLTRVAVNEGLQKVRARRPMDSLDDPDTLDRLPAPRRLEIWYADPEQRYARQEVRRMVEQAIVSLEPIYRVAFVLRDVVGLTSEEAAEALGLGLAAFKSRLLRARLMVREALAARFQENPGLKARVLRVGKMLRQSIEERLSLPVRRKGGR